MSLGLFFFKQKTAYEMRISDWSSDVCSSDLDVLVYGTWSRGFRPGGINRRGTLPPYGPDTLDNYEFGWTSSFGPLRFNGAVYQEDWDDSQLSFLGATGLTENRSAGIARIRGFEFELGYRTDR